MEKLVSECLASVTVRHDFLQVFKSIEGYATEAAMSLVKRTRLVTATSELLTNAIRYAGGGEAQVRLENVGGKPKITVIVSDKGPGIKDLDLAMSRGYSTGKTLGIGLPGTKELVDEFHIESTVGKGTVATISMVS
jgi:serine/threonine-protein kinase RsbT